MENVRLHPRPTEPGVHWYVPSRLRSTFQLWMVSIVSGLPTKPPGLRTPLRVTPLETVYSICGFSGGLDSKEFACNAGDLGLIPGSGRSPGERNGNPLQYSCLGYPIDRGTWRATVHGVTKSLSFVQVSLFSWYPPGLPSALPGRKRYSEKSRKKEWFLYHESQNISRNLEQTSAYGSLTRVTVPGLPRPSGGLWRRRF